MFVAPKAENNTIAVSLRRVTLRERSKTKSHKVAVFASPVTSALFSILCVCLRFVWAYCGPRRVPGVSPTKSAERAYWVSGGQTCR